MKKPIPTVQAYMTPVPYVIDADAPVSAARAMMREHSIRHLPVIDHQTLVGIVSQRDLQLAETLKGVDARIVRVDEVMAALPYRARPSTPLDEVLTTMAREKLGAALVVDGERLVGIFTAIDAMEAFARLLRTGA